MFLKTYFRFNACNALRIFSGRHQKATSAAADIKELFTREHRLELLKATCCIFLALYKFCLNGDRLRIMHVPVLIKTWLDMIK